MLAARISSRRVSPDSGVKTRLRALNLHLPYGLGTTTEKRSQERIARHFLDRSTAASLLPSMNHDAQVRSISRAATNDRY